MSESDSSKPEGKNLTPRRLLYPNRDQQPRIIGTRVTPEGLVIHKISAEDDYPMIIMPAGNKND